MLLISPSLPPSLSLSLSISLSLSDPASRMPSSLKIKILEEKIPQSYDRLRERIEVMACDARLNHKPPIIHRDEFWYAYMLYIWYKWKPW